MFYFSMTSLSPQKKEPITVHMKGKKPLSPFCIREDVDGNKWDINGICRDNYLARPSQPDSYWECTADRNFGFQEATWKSVHMIWEEE